MFCLFEQVCVLQSSMQCKQCFLLNQLSFLMIFIIVFTDVSPCYLVWFWFKYWIKLVFNLETLFSFVASKKTKLQNDLCLFSFYFFIIFIPWKLLQLAVFHLCFQWVNIINFMFSWLLIIPWCVDYKSMPLV